MAGGFGHATGMRRLLKIGVSVAALSVLAACSSNVPKHMRPVPFNTVKALERQDLSLADPILLRIYKQESELEVWKKSSVDGRFQKFKTYDICKWSGELGPKHREGDRQAPEGFYQVTPALMNPNSSYHLSFNLGFPNPFDRAHDRTGSHLMVHGACSSAGCYAMEDDQIEEIYALAREAFDAGQKSFQVQAYPFRMTPENFAMHASNENMPFWRMLKKGSDHFKVTGEAPEISVCDRRYVFNAEAPPGARFRPTGACPRYQVPQHIAVAVAEKTIIDEAEERVVLAKLEAERLNELAAQATQVADAGTGTGIGIRMSTTGRLLSRFRNRGSSSAAPDLPAGRAPLPPERPATIARTADEAIRAAFVSERWEEPVPALAYSSGFIKLD